ncbi:MAG: LacI family DNA-binding transcriptional regulator [Butyricicoccus pullicaecorum]
MTIQEVADEAQVSKTTVSFFLNGKREKMSASTWNRIAAVVEKYDYRPSTTARLMTAKHSCLLGVLVGDMPPFFQSSGQGHRPGLPHRRLPNPHWHERL